MVKSILASWGVVKLFGRVDAFRKWTTFINCKPRQKVCASSREITYHIDTLIPVVVMDKVESGTIYTATVEQFKLR